MEGSLKTKDEEIIGNKEEIYSESGREQRLRKSEFGFSGLPEFSSQLENSRKTPRILEDDILSPEEEGFIKGYEGAS